MDSAGPGLELGVFITEAAIILILEVRPCDIVVMQNSRLVEEKNRGYGRQGGGAPPPFSRREPEREQGSFDPVAGDRYRQCQSSVEVFG